MVERNIVYHTSDYLDVFSPPEVDESLTKYDYITVPENGNFLQTSNGILQSGQRAQFMMQSAGEYIIPGRAFISCTWVPVLADKSTPVLDGSIAPTNTFPIFDTVSIGYGSSSIENSTAYLHQKVLMKKLLKMSNDESKDGSFLHQCWAPDTGVAPCLANPLSATYGLLTDTSVNPPMSTPGMGIIQPLTTPTVNFETTTAGVSTFPTLSVATANSAVLSTLAGTSFTAVAGTQTANPAYNKGFDLRSRQVLKSLNTPPGGAFTNVYPYSGGTCGAVSTMIPLWDLSDVFEDNDKILTGSNMIITLNVNSTPSMALQTTPGKTGGPFYVKMLSINLYMPYVYINPLVEAKLMQRMAQEQMSQIMYEKCMVYPNGQFAVSQTGVMNINWLVTALGSKPTKAIFAFRAVSQFAGADQSQNSMVFQPWPVTNVIDCNLMIGGDQYPTSSYKPGLFSGQQGPNIPFTTLQNLQNRTKDLEGGSCISYDQFAGLGGYSMIAFDLRQRPFKAEGSNSNQQMVFNCTLQMGTGAAGNVNNTPALPCLPSTAGAAGPPQVVPTINSNLQVMAWVFTEETISMRFGSRDGKISIII